MKICFIAPKAYPLFNSEVKSSFGGAQVQFSLLAKELAKNKDLKIHFMVADYGQKDVENYDRINVWNSLNFKSIITKQIYKFLKIFNRIDADIYVQRGLSIFSGLIAIYCKLKKKKFIYMVAHDRETDETHNAFNSRIRNFFANLVFKYSNLIITQNKYQKENLEKKGIKSTIIKSSYPIKEKISNKKNYILWVGRSEPWKRPKLFLKLAERNPKENFIMICPPSTYNPKLSRIIKKMACIMRNLKFIEFVPFNKIDTYFQEAKIFINTSDQEGFPNTFVQAAKNKTPIISLNVNPDDFLDKYNCGFCCNDNFDELNKKLNELMKDEKLYNKMSNNAFKYTKENHDIKKNAKQFYELINSLK